MQPRNTKRYLFANYTLDLTEKVLRRDTEIVALSAKALEVLGVLVSRHGSVVSKEELFAAVWPEAFVEESNLTQCIYTIRRTLGTDEDGRTMIETLPKRGYRFAVAVRSESDRRVAETAPLQGPAPFFRRYGGLLIAGGSMFAVLMLTAILGASYFSSHISAPVESVKFQRLTFSGDVAFPVLSPDGKSFAYTRGDAMYLQDIASGSSVKLDVPGHSKFGNLQFSPEGESILFRDEQSFDAGGQLFQVSRFGGISKLLAENVWSGATPSPDGSRLAFVRFYPTSGEWTLIIKDRNTGEERKTLTRRLPYTIYRSGYPAWSSDGKRLAIVEQTPEQGNVSKLLLVNAATGDAERIETPEFVQLEQVCWLAGDKGLLITGRESNRFFQLWKMSLPGGEPRRITNDPNIYRNISVSNDGKNLLARQYSLFSHIWTAQAGDLNSQKQITFGNLNRDGNSGLSWTPDGKIVYSGRITGDLDLYSVDRSGGSKGQLTDKAGTNNENPFVTADGQYVYFESTRSGRRKIWRSRTDGSDAAQITTDESEIDFLPTVTPDGKTLFYISRNPGSNVVWKQSLVDGTREMMTQQGRVAPEGFLEISSDGRYLAFRLSVPSSAGDMTSVTVLNLETGESKIISLPNQPSSLTFSPDGKSLDYVENIGNNAKIWRSSIDGGQPRLLIDSTPGRIFSMKWSPDGKSFAVSRGRQENDAILLTGF